MASDHFQRVRTPPLDDYARSVLKGIPGVSVGSRWTTFPPDCAPFVGAVFGETIVPKWPEPRPLVVQPADVHGWADGRWWQTEAATLLAEDRRRWVLLPAGSGKTRAVLYAAALRGAKKILVITKTIGIRSYVRDAPRAGGYEVGIVRGRGPDFQVEAVHRSFDITCINYENLWHRLGPLSKFAWDVIVFDESHHLATHQHRGYARWTQAAEALADALVARGGTPWLVTATPVRDRRRDMWRQLRIMYPDQRFGSSWSFMHRYCGAHQGPYGGLVTTGRTNSEELQARVFHYAYYKTKAEVASHLPKSTTEILEIEGTSVVRRRQSARGIEREIAEASAMKLETAVELISDIVRGPGKVVVVTSRRREVDRIRAAVEKATKSVRNLQVWSTYGSGKGGHTGEQRVKICADYFAAADPAVLIATMDSIGESVDLQSTDALIFLALPYTPRQNDQVRGRVTREGQDRPVTFYYIVAKGTIDEVIREHLIEKLDDTDRLGVGGDSTGSASVIRGQVDEAALLAALHVYAGNANVTVDDLDELD